MPTSNTEELGHFLKCTVIGRGVFGPCACCFCLIRVSSSKNVHMRRTGGLSTPFRCMWVKFILFGKSEICQKNRVKITTNMADSSLDDFFAKKDKSKKKGKSKVTPNDLLEKQKVKKKKATSVKKKEESNTQVDPSKVSMILTL